MIQKKCSDSESESDDNDDDEGNSSCKSLSPPQQTISTTKKSSIRKSLESSSDESEDEGSVTPSKDPEEKISTSSFYSYFVPLSRTSTTSSINSTKDIKDIFDNNVNRIQFSRSSVGGSKYLSNAHLNVTPEGCDLIFESRFESGNLAKAVKITPVYYELYLRPDLYTNKHNQWFYFRVTNTRKDVPYRFVSFLHLLFFSLEFCDQSEHKRISKYNLYTIHCLYFLQVIHSKFSEVGKSLQRWNETINVFNN